MNQRRKFLFLLIGLISFFYSRSVDLPDSSYVIQNDGARMPLTIRGNDVSRKAILFVHGGPGGTSMKKIGCKAFNILELEAKVVYWDQRGSVFTDGGDQESYLTIDQYIDDLDHVIDFLEKKLPDHEIYLMGHCWGGALTAAYLANPLRTKKIAGWINVAGAINNPRADSLSMVFVKTYARREIKRSHNTSYWQSALTWYEKNPDFNSADLAHYLYVKKAHGYVLAENEDPYPGYNSKDLLRTPIDFIRYHLNYHKILKHFIVSEIDVSKSLPSIRIPVLVIWGRQDGLVPLPLAYEAFESVGTAECEKKLVVLENAAHTTFYEKPEAFAASVIAFISPASQRTHPCGEVELSSIVKDN